MAHFLPPSDDMLTLVAELRAAGCTWESVAGRVGRAARTIRRWPNKYPDRWAAARHRAERQVAADAESESVVVLRQLLRSEDDKIRWHAAKSLIGLRLELGKLDIKAPPAANPTPLSPEAARLLTFLDGHSDAELSEIIDTLLPLPDSLAGPGGPSPGGRAA